MKLVNKSDVVNEIPRLEFACLEDYNYLCIRLLDQL